MDLQEAIKQAKRELLKEAGIDPMISKILDYPRRIREQQENITALSQMFKATKSNLLAAEGVLMAMIAAEINPNTNKPAFSNKESRDAALAQIKMSDPEYQAALKQFNEAEEAYNSAQFDLKMLEDEFKAHSTVGGMMASKLSLLA
ncbi:hypothetical protein [Phosphitispora fastidiosa]|uniref:hypothetical protein n=1 Tax=Phosphitispora fastidiosa TaxID=2837202 RepID=UPI001E40FE98|nr:hypothetical protein [Phosphitispora fastidiosa]MBU7006350.1 hypothetical protein [Phosphitispora fastidiosa]